ncbi:MAG: SDR family oxidoreductase [Sphingobium sp.]|nr:MAG: SDR family oxidoreductase [Sphingobium sp.]
MAKTFVVTGSSSGIGKAIAERLESHGDRVIRVSRTGADVPADLGTAEGRAKVVAQIAELAPDGIDGICTSAGTSDASRPDLVTATNYFGTTEIIEGLYSLLRKPGGRCVAISSVGQLQAGEDTAELQEACLAGDVDRAVSMSNDMTLMQVYPATKQALSIWARGVATRPEWAGEGIMVNVISPGIVETPMNRAALADPELAAKRAKGAPRVAKGDAQPDDIAELADFLLNCKTNHLIGQVIFHDSGTEALLRPQLK